MVLLPCAAASAAPEVEITGGSDPSGHTYLYTIVHNHDAPLVYVEVPHYRADTFFPLVMPEPWIKTIEWEQEMTNKNSWGNLPGVCKAESDDGVPRGVPLQVAIRINPTGALIGKGFITLRFADGETVRVPAEVATKHSLLHEFGALIAMAPMFVILLLIHSFRKKRKKRRAAAAARASAGQS